MEPILKRLYDGDLYPSEQINIQKKEYKSACKNFSNCYDNFSEKLKSLNPQWYNLDIAKTSTVNVDGLSEKEVSAVVKIIECLKNKNKDDWK